MAVKMYSQNLEQTVITDFFGGDEGTFLDLGANDGETFSNTKQLYLEGWSGINVEASPKAFNELLKNSPTDWPAGDNVRFYNCAATGIFEGRIKLYESGRHVSDDDVALLSTLHEMEVLRWVKTDNQFTEIEVDAMPVAKIIEQSGFGKIDFISIDIEGNEIDVLPHIDLDGLGVRMLCIEWNSREDLKLQYDAIIAGRMKVIYTSPENLIYAK